jgi:large subunit ribosomal protein L19
MNQALLKSVEQGSLKAVQDIRTGYTVKVHQRIKEGEKERVQVFEGLVIAVKGERGPNKTITVRKVVSGVGVEKIFPIHAATIEKIEITKIAKVRRSKLYYMRERSGKSARLKELHINGDHEANQLIVPPQKEETKVENENTPETAEAITETTAAEEATATEPTTTQPEEATADTTPTESKD